ncbi:MAG: hypothetical protein ACYCW6_09625 [Candidatus Xenobia bacterium]
MGANDLHIDAIGDKQVKGTKNGESTAAAPAPSHLQPQQATPTPAQDPGQVHSGNYHRPVDKVHFPDSALG